MQESRRQAYLRAMGIDSYVLRAALPGARPSRLRIHTTAPELTVSTPAPRVPASAKPTPLTSSPEAATVPASAALVRDPVSPKPARSTPDESTVAAAAPRAPKMVTPPPSTSASATPQSTAVATPPEATTEPQVAELAPDIGSEASVDTLRISLSFYRVNSRLAVVTETPFLGSERQTARREALLLSILRALDLQDIELSSPARFRWPLAEDDAQHASGGVAAAQQTLAGFLHKRLEGGSQELLIVFGERCEALFASGGPVAESAALSRLRVLHCSSLDAMLQVPALKRAVWNLLKPLRTRPRP